MLNGLKSLNEVYRPSAPTEDQMNTINDAAKELVNTFMSGNIGQPQVPNAPAPQQNVYNPGQASQMPTFNPNPTPTSAPTVPTTPAQNFNVGMPSQDPDIPFNGGVQVQNQVPPVTPQPSMATQMGFQVPKTNTTFASPMSTVAPASAPAAPVDTMASTKPECYGRHGDPSINPDQCSICGFEFECIESSPA